MDNGLLQMRVCVVADDLTGACDSAVHFLALGSVGVSIWPASSAPQADYVGISTESRLERPDESFERSKQVAGMVRRAGIDLLFRKVDSLLRGNVSADLQGTIIEWGGAVVLAPALPQEGRITLDGRQKWQGGQIDILELLSEAGLEVQSGTPDQARPGAVTICDAATDSDLRTIANRIVHSRNRLIPSGTAGLASQLAAALGLRPAPRSRPASNDPIALIGSPAALEQGRFASEHGGKVLVLGPGELPSSIEGSDAVLVTGGETASRVLHWLGADSLDLCGELLPGVPVGLCRGGPHDGMPFALKSGSFGSIDAVSRGLEGLYFGA